MMSMKVLIKNKENKIIINKSKFIGFVKQVYTKEDITNYLNELKNIYNDATHICYAYILDNEKKYSDDKEPIGTAGMPILDVLEKNSLNHVLAVVVRYFGGVKLGSNGLVRAYTSSIKELLIDNTKEEERGYLIRIIENYSNSEKLDYLLKESNVIKKEYQEKLIIEVIVKENILNSLKPYNYEIIKELII